MGHHVLPPVPTATIMTTLCARNALLNASLATPINRARLVTQLRAVSFRSLTTPAVTLLVQTPIMETLHPCVRGAIATASHVTSVQLTALLVDRAVTTQFLTRISAQPSVIQAGYQSASSVPSVRHPAAHAYQWSILVQVVQPGSFWGPSAMIAVPLALQRARKNV